MELGRLVLASLLVALASAFTFAPANGYWSPGLRGGPLNGARRAVLAHARELSAANASFGGIANFYSSPVTGSGACGFRNAYGIYAASASPALFKNNEGCGSCYAIRCDSSKTQACRPGNPRIIVTVANLCGSGDRCTGDQKTFTLVPSAWSMLASTPKAGEIAVRIAPVRCPRRGGITFTVVDGSNPWYLPLLVSNVGGTGRVAAVEAQVGGQREWHPLQRSWGSVWALNGVAVEGKTVSLRVRGASGQIVTAHNVIPSGWRQSGVYTSRVNFS